MSDSDQLRVYFALRSPYSRLGLHKVVQAGLPDRIDTLAIPFTAPANGAAFLNPTDSPPKLAYYAEDAARMTMRLGLPMAMPNPFDPDYGPSTKAFYAARAAGYGLEMALAMSDARWGAGQDISDPEVIGAAASAAGVPAGCDLSSGPGSAGDDDKALVDQDGVFGVPFAVLVRNGTRERFWGQDRFDLLIEAFSQAV